MFGAPLIIIITYMKADILKPSRQTILREAKDYVMIAVGMILYGIGWTVFLLPNDITTGGVRSEERRVGKECRSRWSPYH